MKASRKHIPAVSMSDLVCHFDGTVQAYLGQKKSWMVLNLGMFNVIHVWCKKVALNSMHQYITIQYFKRFVIFHIIMQASSICPIYHLPCYQHGKSINTQRIRKPLRCSYRHRSIAQGPPVSSFSLRWKMSDQRIPSLNHILGWPRLRSLKFPQNLLFGVVKKAKKQKTCFQPKPSWEDSIYQKQTHHFIWGWLVEVAIKMCFYTRCFYTQSDHPESPTCDPWELDQEKLQLDF